MSSDLDQAWAKHLELTAPIKSIMVFVDELSANYDLRVANLKKEYKADLEEVMACYQKEKLAMENAVQTKANEILSQELKLEDLTKEFGALQQVYDIERAAHKISKDALAAAREEIAQLSAALKSEQELIAVANERIRAANEQVKIELDLRATIEPKKSSLSKTYAFFMQIFQKSTPKAEAPTESEYQAGQ